MSDAEAKERYLNESPTRKQLRRLYLGRASMWLTTTVVAVAILHAPVVIGIVASMTVIIELGSALALGEPRGLE